MKYQNIIIDVNNLFHRAYAVIDKTQTVKVGNFTLKPNGIAKALEMIQKLIRNNLTIEGKIFFIFDNHHTYTKRSIKIPVDYKANRESMPDSFYRTIDYLELILHHYRDKTYVIREISKEADDFVQPIIENYCRNEIVLLVSSDMDWARSITDKVHWDNSKNILDPKGFLNKYKFKATFSNVCFYKTFYGDEVDNLKGVLDQLPSTFFNNIVEEYDNIYNFFDDAIDGKVFCLDELWINKIASIKEVMFRIYELVSFTANQDTLLNNTKELKYQRVSLKMIYMNLKLNPWEVDNRFEKPVESIDSMFGKPDKLKRK